MGVDVPPTFEGPVAAPTAALRPSVKSAVHFIEVIGKFKG
jgi:hypothetical protein